MGEGEIKADEERERGDENGAPESRVSKAG